MHLTLLLLGKRKSTDRYVKYYILNVFIIYNVTDLLLLTDYEFITYVRIICMTRQLLLYIILTY
jgi:hypothetical protein